ncbi:protein-L-isoaspartate O-methyltransferase [Streptomyces sp. NBC_01317]|uniref:hypothetical protein n=1 Tax=Streptomyces sp. NBC_01317 TaxID=2903822 RepID=UPI002E157CB5|nr:protein-L-isoaspartate O-methyltransferase [Streptomyces sp. NBC_01317]
MSHEVSWPQTANSRTHVVAGDGELGVPEHAPYNRPVMTVLAADIPRTRGSRSTVRSGAAAARS